MDLDKAILWSLLDKYDNIDSYKGFCDSISRIIQDISTTYDIVSIYQHLSSLDKVDISKINTTLDKQIDFCLFEINN